MKPGIPSKSWPGSRAAKASSRLSAGPCRDERVITAYLGDRYRGRA